MSESRSSHRPGPVEDIARDEPQGALHHRPSVVPLSREPVDGVGVSVHRERPEVGLGRVVAVEPRPLPHRDGIAALAEPLDLERDVIWREHIVGIEELDEITAALPECAVGSRALSRVRLVDHPDTAPLVAAENVARPIGRPVVDYHHFDVRVGLRERRIERRPDVALGIIGRDTDGDEGLLTHEEGTVA